MTSVLSVLQALGALAVLVGAAIALPLWGALVVDGVLVVLAATAVEHIVTKRPSAPSDARSAAITAGGE